MGWGGLNILNHGVIITFNIRVRMGEYWYVAEVTGKFYISLSHLHFQWMELGEVEMNGQGSLCMHLQFLYLTLFPTSHLMSTLSSSEAER